jgi:hypothetical protein
LSLSEKWKYQKTHTKIFSAPVVWGQDNFQYVDVQLNTVRLRDNLWDTEIEEIQYFSTFEKGRVVSGKFPYGEPRTLIYLSLVQEGSEYSRQVYSVSNVLANIGGLFETIWMFFGGLVWIFQFYGQRLDVVIDGFDVLVEQNRPGITIPGASLN